MGPAGHIHNTVLPAWFQQARQALLEKFRSANNGAGFSLMIKEYTVTFHRALVLVPDIEIDIEVDRVGNSSFVLLESAKQDGHLAAESRVVYVLVDADERPTPIPDHLKNLLDEHRVQQLAVAAN